MPKSAVFGYDNESARFKRAGDPPFPHTGPPAGDGLQAHLEAIDACLLSLAEVVRQLAARQKEHEAWLAELKERAAFFFDRDPAGPSSGKKRARRSSKT